MNSEKYIGKKCQIKTQGTEGTISDVTYRHGVSKRLAARFIVVDSENNRHELMPHEIKIHTDDELELE